MAIWLNFFRVQNLLTGWRVAQRCKQLNNYEVYDGRNMQKSLNGRKYSILHRYVIIVVIIVQNCYNIVIISLQYFLSVTYYC